MEASGIHRAARCVARELARNVWISHRFRESIRCMVVFNDYSRPWYKHPEILRIKRKYEIEKHKDDKAFLLAHPEAVKELRVSIPGKTIWEMILVGETIISTEDARPESAS